MPKKKGSTGVAPSKRKAIGRKRKANGLFGGKPPAKKKKGY